LADKPELEPGYRGYVAGVLDCDGSIWISADRGGAYPRHALRVNVTNTRRGLPQWFAEHFGGQCQHYPKKKAQWRDEYRWQVSGLTALPVLQVCLPYLIIKRKQALLALEFASTIIPGSKAIPESYRQLRADIYAQMTSLNKKGPA
jgi:hypothetical protein